MADAVYENQKVLRSFSHGSRNCYTLPSAAGKKFLLRAMFTYGNYDGLNRTTDGSLFLFGLHIGVNFWEAVNLTNTDPSSTIWKEVLTVAPANNLSVCLINFGTGTPFVSSLELRPLEDLMYPFVNTSVSISYFRRIRFGQSTEFITRYPLDPYDRFWEGWSFSYNAYPWIALNTSNQVRPLPGDKAFQVPEGILRRASTLDANFSFFEINVTVGPNLDTKNLQLLPIFHFAEINSSNPSRRFDIYSDNDLLFSDFSPSRFQVDSMHQNGRFLNNPAAIFRLNRTRRSRLPPLINAFEVYSLVRMDNLTTDSDDVIYMKEVKKHYNLARINWNGDPCSPREYSWEGLTCDYSKSNQNPMIVAVNLSTSGLKGGLVISFMNMVSLENLDLSHNNLTGAIPDYQIKSLKVLDLSYNQLDGPIPDSILQRSQAGKSGDDEDYAMYEEETPLHIDIRRFTYAELKVITNNFQSIIGKGGFGMVYHGTLENGDEVAVKVLMETSIAESTDFLPERLYIALDAAQGLEYLHESCTPSIVHRDVKTPNILLDKNFVGVISDFGLSRAFNDAHTHISTVAAGTLGYLDPEYHATFQLTVKTDVYSFGIVLLEIITGQSPVFMDPQTVHLPNWVRQKIAKGSIRDVVDKKLLDQYDASSLQGAVDLALNCVENAAIDRPTMTEVVSRLKTWLPAVSSDKQSASGTPRRKYSLNTEMPKQFQLMISGVSNAESSFQSSGYTDGNGMSQATIFSGR
ncbi:unnamed protein product [Triticum turgidum subsp. durum]|uniref:non-specific serine/threonine protein kinase n=1 Tax=Triticum turgidum subsp. durum TaxID=4567 RepID=A0A9R0RS61_TRITD|nr:unnamed protein product [Triticum turgidum subsp. durum]